MAIPQKKENSSKYPIAALLKRMLQSFRERSDEELRPYGATAAQLPILFTLEREPGISGAKLARLCTITPQSTQVLLHTIEANGWIVRQKHPDNERMLLARLTPAGKRVVTKSHAIVRDIYAAMLEGLSPLEVSQLEGLLARCAANLATSSGTSAPAQMRRSGHERRATT